MHNVHFVINAGYSLVVLQGEVRHLDFYDH